MVPIGEAGEYEENEIAYFRDTLLRLRTWTTALPAFNCEYVK